MKVLKIFIILFLVTSFSELKSDEANDILKNKILKNIRCLICQGQSVYDSESEFASSIKLIVDRKINEGLKEKQIYQFLREKYGDWVSLVWSSRCCSCWHRRHPRGISSRSPGLGMERVVLLYRPMRGWYRRGFHETQVPPASARRLEI